RTRGARALWSRLLRKRAKSSPSVIPPPSGPTSARRCWITTLNGVVGIDWYLASTVASILLSSQRAVLIHQFDDGHGVVHPFTRQAAARSVRNFLLRAPVRHPAGDGTGARNLASQIAFGVADAWHKDKGGGRRMKVRGDPPRARRGSCRA